jgi:hypothetical protein
MPEYSDYQRKVIERYYDNREQIVLTRLQELVTELFLADSDRKRDRLWQRVDAAMKQLGVPESIAAHVRAKRDATVLAKNVEDWLKRPPGAGKPTRGK